VPGRSGSYRLQLERHYRGLDSRDWKGVFLKAYTEDCVFTTSNGPEVTRGRSENMARLRRFEMFPSSIHVLGNCDIRLSGDSASSVVAMISARRTR
jgi:SnoaL-like domain